jgi:dihydrofolate reductase
MTVIKNLSMIAAIGENYELGHNNDLIWKINEDMKFFRNTTMNSYIVMGRKTYESIYKGRTKLLPGRKHIVLSKKDVVSIDPEGEVLLGDDIYNTLSQIDENKEKKYILKFNDLENAKLFLKAMREPAFIIGGASLYKEFLDYVESIHLTEIQSSFPKADVYFPRFDKSSWEEKRGPILEEDGIKYSHVLYKKLNRK